MKTRIFRFTALALLVAILLKSPSAAADNGECFIVHVVEAGVVIAKGQIIELSPAPGQQADSAYFRVTEFVSGYRTMAIASPSSKIRYCPDKGTILIHGQLFRIEPE